jgi:hypothetical protein
MTKTESIAAILRMAKFAFSTGDNTAVFEIATEMADTDEGPVFRSVIRSNRMLVAQSKHYETVEACEAEIIATVMKEAKKAQEKLQKDNERIHSLIEAANEAVKSFEKVAAI